MSKRSIPFVLACLLATPLVADHHETAPPDAPSEMPEMSAEEQAMMELYAKAGAPGEAHARLAEMAGVWDAEVTTYMGPEAMTTKSMTTREMILDGRVLAETFEGDMMGQPFVGHGRTGYDNVSGKYWSIWMDSMSTGVMMSEGEFDAERNAMVFVGSYNDPTIGGPKTMKMMSTVSDEGHETFEMWEERDGEMVKSMEIRYVRR